MSANNVSFTMFTNPPRSAFSSASAHHHDRTPSFALECAWCVASSVGAHDVAADAHQPLVKSLGVVHGGHDTFFAGPTSSRQSQRPPVWLAARFSSRGDWTRFSCSLSCLLALASGLLGSLCSLSRLSSLALRSLLSLHSSAIHLILGWPPCLLFTCKTLPLL